MESATQPQTTAPDSFTAKVLPVTRIKIADRAPDFASPSREASVQLGADSALVGKRDWSSALDLVSEAFEAIRIADERAAASEGYQNDLIQHHAEQVRNLEARIVAAEKRAEIAESRAKVAEGWLVKFHDTIMDEFQRSLASRPREG